MPTIAQLEYLLAVDTHRHFGRAAKSCHVTQPTLSSGLAHLEGELGIQVFDRSVQPIIATEKGRSIIEQTRIAMSELKKILAIASGADQKVSGSLLIGIIPTISPYLLPLFIENLGTKYPYLKLEIHEMTTQDISEALAKETIDVGLLALPLDGPSTQQISLFNEPFYLYLHETHALANKKSVCSEDIDGKELWLLEEGHCFRTQVLQACKLRGKRPSLANLKFESGSLETLKRLVDQGLGYTLVPHLAMSDTNSIGENSKVLKFEKPAPAREVGLVFRRTQLKRPAIEALAASIKENLPRSLVQAGKEVQVLGI